MTKFAKIFTRAALAGVVAAAGLTASALPASAFVACSKFGECWHARGNYVYRPEFGIVLHPDNWHWSRHEHFRWRRDHEGRGYWRDGVWIAF